MKARLFALGLVCAGLFAWERALERASAERREASSQVRPLVDERTRDGLLIAGLSATDRERGELLYVRRDGRWVCLAARGKEATAGRLQALMNAVVQAEGVVLDPDPEHPERYGFGPGRSLRFGLHGPQLGERADQHRLIDLELGASIPETGGSYVRRWGESAVWAIDADPRASLRSPPGTELPPLLDPNVISEGWAGGGFPVRRVELRFRGDEAWELHVEADAETGGAAWVLEANGERLEAHPVLLQSYLFFLAGLPYLDLLPEEERERVLPGRRRLSLRLTPAQGEALELHLSKSVEGSAALSNEGEGLLYAVSAEVAELIASPATALADLESGNPWGAFLQARFRSQLPR